VRFGIEEEADETRSDGPPRDTTARAVGVEDGLDAVGLVFEIRADGLGHRVILQRNNTGHSRNPAK
jgi:hypothetical protein